MNLNSTNKKPRKIALWCEAFPKQHEQLHRPAQENRQRRLDSAKARRLLRNRQVRKAMPHAKTAPTSKKRAFGSPVSAKRRLEMGKYKILSIEFMQSHQWCQRCLTHGQKTRATECHHWAGRGKNYLRVETFRASCHACNQFARNEPQKAIEEGWRAPFGEYANR